MLSVPVLGVERDKKSQEWPETCRGNNLYTDIDHYYIFEELELVHET